jgi:hypothetical protein
VSSRASRESARDQDESAFTPLLRRLLRCDPHLLAAVYVDPEGECVDYCTLLDPFDAKVSAAQMMVVMTDVVRRLLRIGLGNAFEVGMEASERVFVVRRIDDDYALVLVAKTGANRDVLDHNLDRAVFAFRGEAGLTAPSWEPEHGLSVELRRAVGWRYAPRSYSLRGRKIGVTDVLGRFDDREQALECFRVRDERGYELTLAYDQKLARWFAFADSEE